MNVSQYSLSSKYLLSMALIGIGLVTTSCGQSDKEATGAAAPVESTEAATAPVAAPAAGEEEKILNIYNWSDYLAEDTIQKYRI